MASFLPEIYQRMQSEIFAKLPPSLGVKSNNLYDQWRIGPELERDIEGARAAGELPLNALITSPLTPIEADADAPGTAQLWGYPLDLRFVYERRQDRDLLQICEAWADPLHDILCQRQLRRLNNFVFRNSAGRELGHVTRFRVAGPPDFYDKETNDLLATLDLAAFRQRLEIELVVQLDPDDRRT